MSKIVLTRKGAYLAGACTAYLSSKLAKDKKLSIDIAPLFADVTNDNAVAKTPAMLTSITTAFGTLKGAGAMAADAELDHLPELLNHLTKEKMGEGADTDPNSGLPMTKEQMDAKAKDESEEEEKKKKDAEAKDAEVKAKDRKAARDARRAARDAKWEEMKKGMDAEKCAAIDAWTKENDAAEDAADGEPEPKKDQEGEKAMDKGAMDAAIKQATDQIKADAKALREAEAFVKDWVGDVTLAHDAAIDVYRTTLKTLKPELDIKGISDAASLRGMISLIEKPGAKRRRQEADPLAHDAAGATSFEDAFPATKRFA
jgi:chemotaxis protein histidine kinase CheA